MIYHSRTYDSVSHATRRDHLLPVQVSRSRNPSSWKWVALIVGAFLVMGVLL